MTVIRRKKIRFVYPPPVNQTTYVDPTNFETTTTNNTQTVINNGQNLASDEQTNISNALVRLSSPPVTSRAMNLPTNCPSVSIANRTGLSINNGSMVDCVNFIRCTYNTWQASFQSKLANVLYSSEFAKKLTDENVNGIAIYSLPLGIVLAELQKHLKKIDFSVTNFMLCMLFGYLMNTHINGLQTTIYCAVDEKCKKVVGLYYVDCNGLNRQLMSSDDSIKCLNGNLELANLNDSVF